MRKLNLLDGSVDLENITREIDINLSGPVRMVQQFLPHLKTKRNAAIMNVTSAISLVPFPLSPIYSATKAGLRFYTKSLRVQLKKTNVKVFELVAPAARTPLNDKFADDVDSRMLMEPSKLAAITVKGLENDRLEIYPGISFILRYLSRIAPQTILNQLAKTTEKSFAGREI